MRAGAGYVTRVRPGARSRPSIAAHLLEVMSVALRRRGRRPQPATAPPPCSSEAERAATRSCSARGSAAATAPRRSRASWRARAQVPLLLDADGLNAHAGRARRPGRGAPAPTVLTPHAGELGRLLGVAVRGGRARAACEHVREAARARGAIVVLKGDDTLVARPDGRVARQPRRDARRWRPPGTGDVLAGVDRARCSRGARAVHRRLRRRRAARRARAVRAAAARGPDGVIARDVIAALPGARR